MPVLATIPVRKRRGDKPMLVSLDRLRASYFARAN
jgi:hypothetical protein